MSGEADRIPWRPGMPVLTEEDHAEWQVWRRERILKAQRERRQQHRRMDYYPSKSAAKVIDALRTNQPGGDISSIIDGIICEWLDHRPAHRSGNK